MKATTGTTILLLFLIILLAQCNTMHSEPALFQLMSNTGIDFTNRVENSKDFNILTYRNFYNGGGVATGDINNDGLPDVFFTSNMGRNTLYLNKGNFQFEDITDKAGFINSGKWGTGVVFVDINADGWLDIYVCNAGYQKGVSNENELYINNGISTSPRPTGSSGRASGEGRGEVTFTEAAKQYGLNESGYTTHAAFFDYDGDGDLDCYMLKNSFIPVNTLNYANKRELRAEDWPVADFLKGGGDKLLRNDNGHYTDVSKEAGIYGSLIGFGLGVTIGDVNGDAWPDIYISNDFFERDYLYLNQKNGSFKEDLENCMQHVSHSSMGADIADINNDGYPDIFTTDMLPDDDYRLKTTSSFENIDVNRIKVKSGFYYQYMQNCLQVNNKNGKFLETAFYSGVAASDWSWGALMFDADNDGLTDIYVCNGIYHDVTDQDFIDFFANDVIQNMVLTGQKGDVDNIINKMPSQPIPNKAYKNLGNLKFTEEGGNWGFTQKSFSNGAAYADLDNDGDLDLVVSNVNQEAFVYQNSSRQATKNNFISLLLKQNAPNTFAIGSSIKIFQGNKIISREIEPSRGFQSSVDYRQVIGLGKEKIDSIIIVWPDRTATKHDNLQVNKSHVIKKPEGAAALHVSEIPVSPLLQQSDTLFDKHREDDFIDFYYERNLPIMVSREGPKAAHGDVNGDGLIDVYICGAAGQQGQLYLQTNNGFVKKEQEVFKKFAALEETAALFFDCDKDGDVDLFTGAGGNNSSILYQFQNHLYINDGKGSFALSQNALPASGVNVSVVTANDFDRDGDADLFVGGRSVPLNYGVLPQSYILMNDGKGNFTDMAETKNKDIAFIGMVTSAAWADVSGDKKEELIIAGEWMAPRIFSFNGNHFVEVNTNLTSMQGWWQSLSVADIDGDGRNDLILGNIGENFYLQPDTKNPAKMWVNDFDNNGTVDKIFTRTINGRDMPVFMKRDMVDQIPSLKKQNLKNVDYAKKSVQELFPKETIGKSKTFSFNYSSSCIAFSEGNGKFTIKKLDVPVQLSSVHAILSTDINEDGRPDLIMGGNKFELLPQFCRLDASLGHALLNKGGRSFQYLLPNESGVELRGEIRDIIMLPLKNETGILFLQNDDYPVLYKPGKHTIKQKDRLVRR